MSNDLVAVTTPGPSGTAVSLGSFGTPVASNAASFIAGLGAWTAYTPTWAATGTAVALGNGTISGRYAQLSKWLRATGLLTTGGTTTYGTGTYTFTLPAGFTAAAAVGTPVGIARLVDTSATTRYVGVAVLASSTTIAISTHAAAADIGPTVPFTFATTDIIAWDIDLELA